MNQLNWIKKLHGREREKESHTGGLSKSVLKWFHTILLAIESIHSMLHFVQSNAIFIDILDWHSSPIVNNNNNITNNSWRQKGGMEGAFIYFSYCSIGWCCCCCRRCCFHWQISRFPCDFLSIELGIILDRRSVSFIIFTTIYPVCDVCSFVRHTIHTHIHTLPRPYILHIHIHVYTTHT